ncbi:MAG: hypothetical protein ACOC1F_07175 [Myxococcota bacterium]
MSPSEILANLSAGNPKREQAAAALMKLLDNLARRPLVERSSKDTFSIDDDDRQEVVDRAVVRVLEKSPLPVVGKSDGECVNYVKQILLRLFLTIKRKQKQNKETILSSEHLEQLPGILGQGPDEGAALRNATRALLSHVVERMTARSSRDAGTCTRAWAQIQELVFEEGDMRHILARDEGLQEGSPEQEFRKARARVLTQHKRFRFKLLAAIEAMRDEGELSRDEADMARRLVEIFLLRRQKRNPGSV